MLTLKTTWLNFKFNSTNTVCVLFQWQHEDVLGPNNQPLSVSIPPRSVILSNMKKKLYKLSQDEGSIVAIQVSFTFYQAHSLPVAVSTSK